MYKTAEFIKARCKKLCNSLELPQKRKVKADGHSLVTLFMGFSLLPCAQFLERGCCHMNEPRNLKTANLSTFYTIVLECIYTQLVIIVACSNVGSLF